VDAPAHFIEGAKKSESLALDALIGEAQVIDVPNSCLSIGKEFVSDVYESGNSRVLFKTRNSKF